MPKVIRREKRADGFTEIVYAFLPNETTGRVGPLILNIKDPSMAPYNEFRTIHNHEKVIVEARRAMSDGDEGRDHWVNLTEIKLSKEPTAEERRARTLEMARKLESGEMAYPRSPGVTDAQYEREKKQMVAKMRSEADGLVFSTPPAGTMLS